MNTMPTILLHPTMVSFFSQETATQGTQEIPEHTTVTKFKQTPTVTASGFHLEFC